MSEKIKRLALHRKNESSMIGSGRPVTGASMSLQAIENMFIEKLGEKYRFTERDLKRAFFKFDKDNSGQISVAEMAAAIQVFVQGVDPKQIVELVRHYDVDGDGEISLSEFSQFIMSRNSNNKDDWLSVVQLIKSNSRGGRSSKAGDIRNANEDAMEADLYSMEVGESVVQEDENLDKDSIAYRAKIYLQNLRSMLLKRAMQVRLEGKLSVSERMSHHTPQLAENIARSMLSNAFRPYTSRNVNNNTSTNNSRIVETSSAHRVDYNAFSIVMNKFVARGGSPPSEFILKHLFRQCCDYDTSTQGNRSRAVEVSRADPDILVDMMFDGSRSQINKFGFAQPVASALDTKRPAVGPGPFVLGTKQMTITDVPVRVNTSKCKTALASPSNFTLDMVQRSAQAPQYTAKRDFVLGMNCLQLYSGGCVKHLTTPIYDQNANRTTTGKIVVYVTAALGIVFDTDSHIQYYFDGHTDDITCFAVSDPVLWSSTAPINGAYEEQPRMRQIVASGQMGKSPHVCLWETWPTGESMHCHLITRIGEGFFQRGVCSVQFSPDVKYVLGISCDDKHSIGIWNLSGQMIAEHVAHSGIPPAVRDVVWSRVSNQDISYIVAEDTGAVGNGGMRGGRTGTANAGPAGEVDVICTVGERHVKFWAFKRPTTTRPQATLLCKAGHYGRNMQSNAPALCLCAAFLDDNYGAECTPNSGNSVPVVVGATNGNLYVFALAACMKIVPLFGSAASATSSSNSINPRAAGVCCIEVLGDKIYCGGSTGDIKIVDANNFSVVRSIVVSSSASVQVSINSQPSTRSTHSGGGSANGSARPMSAGRNNIFAPNTHGNTPRCKTSAVPISSNPISGYEVGVAASAKKSVKSASAGGAFRPKDAWGGPNEDIKTKDLPVGVLGFPSIVSCCLIRTMASSSSSGPGNGSGRNSSQFLGLATEMLVITAFGKAMWVSLVPNSPATVQTLMYYHYAPLWAVASVPPLSSYPRSSSTNSSSSHNSSTRNHLFATGGEDKWLCIWDNYTKLLLARVKVYAPIRSICWDNTANFLAIGTSGGSFGIYQLTALASSHNADSRGKTSLVRSDNTAKTYVEARNRQNTEYTLTLICKRRDCKEDISDIKFSANNKMIAVASHDNYIDLYAAKFNEVKPVGGATTGIVKTLSDPKPAPAVECKYLKRLRGHSSFVTHIDWSADNTLIRSTCGAYELLFWDVAAGRQILNSTDNTEADSAWNTHNCIFGFDVMGVWKAGSSGDDINAIDVDIRKGLAFTADDYGTVKCFNYPCVIKNAPYVKMKGHSSHVMDTKLLHNNNTDAHSVVVSVGGNDNSIMIWKVATAVPRYE